LYYTHEYVHLLLLPIRHKTPPFQSLEREKSIKKTQEFRNGFCRIYSLPTCPVISSRNHKIYKEESTDCSMLLGGEGWRVVLEHKKNATFGSTS
jgi:hypothetical protein